MKNKIVVVPSTKTLIKPSPGFAKKGLGDHKIDLLALCGFGCRYCSSNTGNYLRIYREQFAALTAAQLGQRLLPANAPELTFLYDGVVDQLRRELAGKPRSWGEGYTLMFSMLTDGFSPILVEDGTTEAALRVLVERTAFRIRVLTKNAVIGTDHWVEFFARHRDRFVVGLSCGTLDEGWAGRIEAGASTPSERLAALRRLQEARVPTFGMLCPVFPDVLQSGRLDELIDLTNPTACEAVWVEPYNDRVNWRAVRDGYQPGSPGWNWLTTAFGAGDGDAWSEYATTLYKSLRLRSEAEGWLAKLRFMLYEAHVNPSHVRDFCDLSGLLLQSPGDKDGRSKNPAFRALQDPHPETGRRVDRPPSPGSSEATAGVATKNGPPGGLRNLTEGARVMANDKKVAMNHGVANQIPTPVYSTTDSVYEGGSLLTAEMKSGLPDYLEDCDEDPMVYYRFFCNGPFTNETDHYILCGSPDVHNRSKWADDFLMEVCVNGELGLASLREIESFSAGFAGGFRFERDRYFEPRRLSELLARRR